MFVIFAILVGILTGLSRRGRMGGLFSQKISLWYFGVTGLVVQLGLHLLYYTGITGFYLTIINFVSYILILVTLVFNLNHIWAILATIGFTANFLVIFINGGLLPVSANVIDGTSPALAASINNEVNAIYMLMDTASTRVWFLGDLLRIPGVGGITGLYGAVPSIALGTFLILIGLAGWVQHNMAMAAKKITHVFEDDDFGTSDEIIPKEKLASGTIFQEQPEEKPVEEYHFSELPVNGLYVLGNNGSDDFNQDDLNFEDEEKYLQEEALTDMTEYIPRLTPEMIAEIRRNSLEESETLLRDDTNNTRVFSASGKSDEKKENKMRHKYGDDSSMLSASNDMHGFGDDIGDDRYLVKSKWTEWKPCAMTDEDESEPQLRQSWKTTAGQVVNFDDVDHEDEQKKAEWNPREVKRNAYASGVSNIRNQRSNPFSTFFNRTEKPTQKGRSSQEMMDIWHRAFEEDSRKRKAHYQPEDFVRTSIARIKTENPASESTGQMQTEDKTIPQGESLQQYEQARNQMAEKWDAKSSAAKLINLVPNDATERVDSKEYLRKSLSEKSELKTAEAVSNHEREKAGYEKVELEIEGRVVSFWRKKKV